MYSADPAEPRINAMANELDLLLLVVLQLFKARFEMLVEPAPSQKAEYGIRNRSAPPAVDEQATRKFHCPLKYLIGIHTYVTLLLFFAHHPVGHRSLIFEDAGQGNSCSAGS